MNTAPNTQANSGALFAAAAFAGLTLAIATSAGAADYIQTNLVTDNQAALVAAGYSPAAFVDPSLVNPWGMDHAPGGPWVVADAGFPTSGATGPVSVVTGYNGQGVKTPLAIVSGQAGAGGSAGLTGLAYNGGAGFVLPDGSPATYLFSNLDGSISGWNAAAGANAALVVPGRAVTGNAKYSGMELSSASDGQTYLYAANHQTGTIDVFDTNFAPHSFGANAFVDPNAGALLAYNVESIGGDIWVTYAAASASNQPLGTGFVDEFTADGKFIRRFASGGDLDSPWAVTLAPSDFGAYSGDVLIGNFTHGQFGYISAYSPDGVFQDVLSADGKPIAIDGLWELAFGDGGASGPTNALYFAAGIVNESHGLFGEITAVPEPASWALMILGVAGIGAQLRSARRRAVALG